METECRLRYARRNGTLGNHASYGDDEAVIDIRTLVVIRGKIPPRALALILEWAGLHRQELVEDWTLCATKQIPKKIPPLA
jgi:hypothetical protein